MYAVVRSGGRQHKVAVGDVLEIDRVDDAVGSEVNLTPVLLVDGEPSPSTRRRSARPRSPLEVLAEIKGPKIKIFKYKNKTGYRKRQGHRQRYTQVRVTGIES